MICPLCRDVRGLLYGKCHLGRCATGKRVRCLAYKCLAGLLFMFWPNAREIVASQILSFVLHLSYPQG